MACDRDVPFDPWWTRRLSDRAVREAVLHPRRRYALYYLRERSAPVAVEELAGQVAAWERRERGGERDRGTTGERAAVVSSLRRHHVPYLAERGIVSYDPERDRVAYDTDDSTLALWLANDPRTSVRWHRIYLGLTALSVALLALVRFGVGPLAAVPPIAVAGVVVVLFGAASVVHWYDVHRWRRDAAGEPPDFLVTLGENVVERAPEEESEEREGSEEDEESEGSKESKKCEGGREDADG
jgi:hypothetical protein